MQTLFPFIHSFQSTSLSIQANNYRKYYINQRSTLHGLQEHARYLTFMETNDFL